MSAYDQTKNELCEKCGWAMKFPKEPCRCELERENAALETTLKLVYGANQRGIKAWQQAHPDKSMVWPDQAKLVEWLVRENAALRELAARMAAEMRELDHEFSSLRDYDAARNRSDHSGDINEMMQKGKEAQP